MTLDFSERLLEYVEGLELEFPVQVGSLDTEDSISIHALPGGRTIRKFFDGTADRLLNYEFSVKTRKQKDAIKSLDKIAEALPEAEIVSENGSYDFRGIEISSEPFNSDMDERYFYHSLSITAELTTYKQGGD